MNRAERLGTGALLLGLTASVAGSPYRARHASVDVQDLAVTVRRETDHVSALELAQWIRARRPGLHVVDVRPAADYDAYHIPTADRIPLDSIPSTPFLAGDIIVLYSEGDTHAAQAWFFLRALGFRQVFFLRGGLYEWLTDVMNPTLSQNASARDSVVYRQRAEVSRFFGGQPRTGAVASPLDEAVPLPSSTATLGRQIRRRGC